MLFNGYYTETEGAGELLISATGKITAKFTNNRFSKNTTLYAKWILQHKRGARCTGKKMVITGDRQTNDKQNSAFDSYKYMYEANCISCGGVINMYTNESDLSKGVFHDITNYGGQCPRYYCSECQGWIYYPSDWK